MMGWSENFENALELHFMNKELERTKDNIIVWITEEKQLNPMVLNSQYLRLPGLIVKMNRGGG